MLGSVQGDLHDIGKNLVAIMLKGAGFEVIDLGNDVPPPTFVAAAKSREARVIGMSALLTTTMPVMKEVVDLLKKETSPAASRPSSAAPPSPATTPPRSAPTPTATIAPRRSRA